MRFQNLFIILIFAVTFTGCNSCSESTGSVNESNANKTIAQENSNQNTNVENTNDNTNTNTSIDPLEMKPADENKVQVKAVTLKPVFDAYCDAMRKKDDAGIRRVFSKASIKVMETDMKAEGFSSIAEYLSNEPVGNKCELVNENIQGDLGEATVITETYPTGTSLKFVKENNEWKLTNESSDFDRVNKK